MSTAIILIYLAIIIAWALVASVLALTSADWASRVNFGRLKSPQHTRQIHKEGLRP
jgi:hypothetical protein